VALFHVSQVTKSFTKFLIVGELFCHVAVKLGRGELSKISSGGDAQYIVHIFELVSLNFNAGSTVTLGFLWNFSLNRLS